MLSCGVESDIGKTCCHKIGAVWPTDMRQHHSIFEAPDIIDDKEHPPRADCHAQTEQPGIPYSQITVCAWLSPQQRAPAAQNIQNIRLRTYIDPENPF